MQLELNPEIESALNQESKALGITPSELTRRLLAQHTSDWQSARAVQSDRSQWTIDDYIAYLKTRNSNQHAADPHAVDWQAIKAEGRKY